MDESFYLQNYKSVSRTLWILLFAALAINIYLVQRSFEWNHNISEKIIDPEAIEDEPYSIVDIVDESLMQQQGEHLGLKINYGTLTIVWPLILSGIYVVIYLLISKIKTILQTVKELFPELDLKLLKLDLNSIILSTKRQNVVVFFFLLFIIPFIGFSFHAYSGYYMNDLLNTALENKIQNLGYEITNDGSTINKLNYLFYFQTIISLAFLFLTIIFNTKTYKHLHKSNALILSN